MGGTLKNEGEGVGGVDILVEGPAGFSESATTDDTGRWSVPLPGGGEYTATLQVETLPDGIAPRDPDNVSRTIQVGTTSTANVLFPLGEGAAGGGDFLAKLFSRLITGLNFGLLLALAAIGITLIFGTTGVNNFAHGEMLTFGAIVYFTFTTIGLNMWLAILATLLASALFGWTQDAVIFKPLRRKRVGLVQVLIVTIGLSIAVRYGFQFFFGGGTENYPNRPVENVTIGSATITLTSLVSMFVSIIVLLAVGFFLTRTRFGKATRAVSDNSGLAAASGINTDFVIRIVWVLAAVLTGLAGILYGFYRGVTWDMGFTILLPLFAAVTLGGLGSAFGALIGAIVIGLITEISTIWIPTDLRYAVALVVLIVMLLIRPQGLLGRKERIG